MMLRKQTGSPYPGVMELLPRVVLAALAARGEARESPDFNLNGWWT